WVTNTTYAGRWRRVGDSMQIQATISLAGAPTTATFDMTIPSGFTIDTTKLAGGAIVDNALGSATSRDAGTANFSGCVRYSTTTTVQIVGDAGSGGLWTQAVPF